MVISCMPNETGQQPPVLGWLLDVPEPELSVAGLWPHLEKDIQNQLG